MSEKEKQEEKEKKPPIFGPEPPSDEFMRAVACGGGTETMCGFCGRTHFATWDEKIYWEWSDGKNDDDEPSYLVYLRECAEENPDSYIEHGDVDSISWGHLNGKEIVWGCPCNAGYRYEQFIKSHARIISEYLSSVAQKELEKATSDVQIAEKIEKSNHALERRVNEAESRRIELEEKEQKFRDRLRSDQAALKSKKERLEKMLLEERSKLDWEKERTENLEKLIKEVGAERKEIFMKKAERALNSTKPGRKLDI